MNVSIESSRCNEDINLLLKRTVLAGGKRLRPLLTYVMGSFFDQSIEKMRPFARAVELVHAASLSHDDVIDNASIRRGLPSINIVGSNKRAVLAGDYLLSDVIVSLTNTGSLAAVKEMAMVIQDLSQGEWLQLDASVDKNYTRELIEEIALKKTASVMSYCTVIPTILNDSPEYIVDYAKEFGKNLGLAFQYVDDTLDFSEKGQKDKFLDLQNGLINSVLFEWLQLNPLIFEKFKNGLDLNDLFSTDHLDEAILIVKKRAMDHLVKAESILEILDKEIPFINPERENSKKVLYEILSFLRNREF